MTSREFFAEVRRAAADVEQCQRVMGELDCGLPPTGGGRDGGRTGESDPVYAACVERERMLADARSRMDAAQELIGEALRIIEGLRGIDRSVKPEILELYYIDAMSWRQVARELGVSVSTAHDWGDEMLDLIDDNPHSYIVACRFLDDAAISPAER